MTKLLISAAQGPAECEMAAALALKRLLAEAEQAGLKARCLDEQRGAQGLQSAVLALEGAGSQAFARRVCGTWQWIWQSRLRPQQRRKNWFIGVFVLEEQERPTAAAQLHFQACKASGKGGQHVNKTNSAVWLSDGQGLRLKVRQERSQQANKRLAVRRYAALQAEQQAQRLKTDAAARRREHGAVLRGNPRRVFSGDDFREIRPRQGSGG